MSYLSLPIDANSGPNRPMPFEIRAHSIRGCNRLTRNPLLLGCLSAAYRRLVPARIVDFAAAVECRFGEVFFTGNIRHQRKRPIRQGWAVLDAFMLRGQGNGLSVHRLDPIDRGHGGGGAVADSVGHLPDKLGADVTTGKDAGNGRFHSVIGDDISLVIAFQFRRQNIGIGMKSDKDKYGADVQSGRDARLDVFQRQRPNLGVAVDPFYNCVPAWDC
jgi:hypothetical protein